MRRLILGLTLLLSACSGGPLGGSSAPSPGGFIVLTAGGTALTDGDTNVPPTLDLGQSGDNLTAGVASATLDGTPLVLHQDHDTLRASVAAMAFSSPHHLAVRITDRPDQNLDFHVVGRTGVSAAAWSDASGPLADVVFERAPDRAAVTAAIPGATLTWSDDHHVRLRWTTAPPAELTLPAGIPADRGSVLDGPLRLGLSGLNGSALRRATVPAAPSAAGLKLTGWATETAASRASAAAHAGKLNALSPTGWRAHADGSLSGRPDAGDVAAAQSASLALWPIVQNDAADSDGTGRLLGDPAAAGGLITTIVQGATHLGAAGVHLDFEGVSGGDRDRLTSFVALLAGALHAHGVKLAVDVVPHKPGRTNSASAAYDLAAIAATADLVVLMAYDQHTAASGPGPVAGLDWQAQELAGSLTGLSPSHVLLGIPLYARRWEGGGAEADSYAGATRRALADTDPRYDYDFAAATPLLRGVNSSGATVQTWFDDVASLRSKLGAVARFGLGGAAAWRLGFEDPALWSAL